jgi:hypothetical protein
MRCLLVSSIAVLAALTLAASGGCRMCASPYDYCGPVVDCDDGGYSNGYHPGVGSQPAAGQYYENKSAPEEINRPQSPKNLGTPNLGTPSPTPASGPMARSQNPYMRSSRY